VTTGQIQFLEDLLKNEVFLSVLAAFAEDQRKVFIAQLVAAHNMQNPQVSAMATGALDFCEGLPTTLRAFFNSELERLKSQ